MGHIALCWRDTAMRRLGLLIAVAKLSMTHRNLGGEFLREFRGPKEGSTRVRQRRALFIWAFPQRSSRVSELCHTRIGTGGAGLRSMLGQLSGISRHLGTL